MGTRLGIITNQKGTIFDLNEEIKFSILLKLLILPFIVFLISKFLNFDYYQSSALILQAGTPTAISTILMAEAYDVKQKSLQNSFYYNFNFNSLNSSLKNIYEFI